MFDEKKRVQKVIKFYNSLSPDLLNEISGNLSGNRELRRNLSKCKTQEAKLNLLLSPAHRQMFADVAYNTAKDHIPLELDTAGYDDIISSITDNNKAYIVIFFFRWCYEKDNDEKYFNTFVDSDIFECILDGRSIKDLPIDNARAETISEISSESADDIPVQSDDVSESIIEEEVHTVKLLGRIEKRTTYYNFFPQFKLIDGTLVEIPAEQLKADYPETGAINLYHSNSSYSGNSYSFLNNDISTDLNEDKYITNVYVVEFDENELEENNNDKYRLKLDLHRLDQEGVKLRDIIQPASDYGIYKVVTSESKLDNTLKGIGGFIYLCENNLNEKERVLLDYDGKYFGPFEVGCRTYDNKYYIRAEAEEKDYLVPFFSTDNVELVELEKQINSYDPTTYTDFVQIKGVAAQHDAITDDILLDKISDNVSIELAVDNPEEFAHICNNSPFLAKLPKNIINERLNRLQEIIDNTERFKDKQREVFEALKDLYHDTPSDVSNKAITDSETYKDLYRKYNDERSKNEAAEKQIQELLRNQKEQNATIENLRNVQIGIASSEEISELKEQNRQLSEDLERIKAISDTSADIKNLTEEKNRLEGATDVYRKQAAEYERKLSTLEMDISNAIDAAGSKGMASLAFEPFISSEMMKKAASWDTQEEEKEYDKLRTKLSLITPSSISDNELINYIVKYVQERREYSHNDIINIYISIAQNFITIFSGEPGTGKTSMCNIIAESLGLLNYGEGLNRFVSVSVERGWSSKRDFVGYYNPLTRKYDKSNSKIYDALRLLDVEKRESKYPYLIMLDEANLSPIEYYWADFMRLTDRTSSNDNYINIGTDRELFVPETMKFVATINTDQTTETLSPRLIDRACIIKLPKVELKQDAPDAPSSPEIITWENFRKVFSKETELNQITLKALKDIYKLFNDYGMNVSPRIHRNIEDYIKAAQDIMVDENALAREIALDFAIVQKLLPKINGYYDNYERFFDSLKQQCKEHNLHMTEAAIAKIVKDQERNMGYCQYLI